jgi:hypothetical protein
MPRLVGGAAFESRREAAPTKREKWPEDDGPCLGGLGKCLRACSEDNYSPVLAGLFFAAQAA